jgi:two-component sensor histidine kinase
LSTVLIAVHKDCYTALILTDKAAHAGGRHTDEPVVEEKPGNEPEDFTGRALRLRIRQQELLAELGLLALQRTSFTNLLNQTARMTAEGLEAEFCKIMEYIPSDKRLLVRAGVGWGEDVVGNATVGADLDSPAGYALQTGKPVISNHLENEERFRTPELLVQHGIRRAMNVILQGDGLPFGVLEVDSRSEGEFGEHDIAFLQGAANVLGMAIEQQQYQRKLQSALDRHQILLKEVNHRVKNSLQVVSSMLNLQAILAVGRAYNRLAYNADYENIDLVGYLREIVEDLEAAVAPCEIQLDTPKEIQFAADRAILVALIVNELILNAAKHAYADSQEGVIHLRLVSSDDKAVSISVSDDGIGLPADFDPALSKRLGTRIALGLAGQLGAELTRQKTTKGTHFTLVVPLHAAAD